MSFDRASSCGAPAASDGSEPDGGTEPFQAFLWDKSGGLRAVPVDIPGTSDSTATDVNEHGQVVGTAAPSFLFDQPTAFLWSPAEGLRVLAPPAGLSWTHAAAVNDAGQVVGTATDHLHIGRAVVWEPPGYEPTLLPTPSPGGQGFAIANDEDGTVIGWVADTGDDGYVRWSSEPGRPFTPITGFAPRDIDGGDIVGTRSTSSSSVVQAVAWEAGTPGPVPLGSLGGSTYAVAVSNGVIVGSAEDGPGGPSHPARFSVP